MAAWYDCNKTINVGGINKRGKGYKLLKIIKKYLNF
jgi:hypothetical protein